MRTMRANAACAVVTCSDAKSQAEPRAEFGALKTVPKGVLYETGRRAVVSSGAKMRSRFLDDTKAVPVRVHRDNVVGGRSRIQDGFETGLDALNQLQTFFHVLEIAAACHRR